MLLYTQSPNELAPNEDQGVVFGILDTPPNASIDQMSIHAVEVNKVFQSFPETAYTFQITQTFGGFSGMGLKSWTQRDRTVFDIKNEVQAGLGRVPGVSSFAVVPAALPGGGDFPVEIVVASTADTERILAFVEQLKLKAVASGKFAFPPIVSVKYDRPQAEFVIDRDKVAALGLDLAQVGAALTRLRPILMTSLATVFGHFPLVLVIGAGAAARNSIGLVLVGGMTIGTIFTLLIVPSLYMLIAKEQKKHA